MYVYMVVDNGGEMPLYNNGKKNNSRCARSTSSGQKQLQMQFDAWMNSLNIAKVPETVSKEMTEKGKGEGKGKGKGKGKTSADFVSSGKERTLKKSKSSIQNPTPNNIKKGQLNTSSGKLVGGGGTTTVPQGSNHVAADDFAEVNNHQGSSADPTMETEHQHLMLKNIHTPNTVKFNSNGGNKKNNVVDTDEDDDDDDNMIVLSSSSPPPYQVVPPSSSGVWSDLDDIFPSLDPLGEDVPLTQKIQETPIWEWDDLYFP